MRRAEDAVADMPGRVSRLVKDAIAEARAPMSAGHRQAAFLAVALAFVIVAYGAPHKVVHQDAGGAATATLTPVPAVGPPSTTTTVASVAPPAPAVAAVPVTPAAPPPQPPVSTVAPAAVNPVTPTTARPTTTTTSTPTTSTTAPPAACAVANPLGGCLTGR
jgi:hypothetical protein